MSERQSFQFLVTVDVDPEPGVALGKVEARKMAREALAYATGCDLPRSGHSYTANGLATATVASIRTPRKERVPGVPVEMTTAERVRLSHAFEQAIADGRLRWPIRSIDREVTFNLVGSAAPVPAMPRSGTRADRAKGVRDGRP